SMSTPMATERLDADLQCTPTDQTTYRHADHAGCKDDYKSTPGGLQFLGGKLVSWSSKKQDCTAMSTAEAEYVSLSACYAQVIWMRTQLLDYRYKYNRIPMYRDSKSAIAISCNPVQHSKTKHIDIRYHFIKEHVEKGTVEIYFVGTEYQLADLFTKALPKERFEYLVHRTVIIMAQQQHAVDVHPDELCPPNKRYDLIDANKKVDLEHVQCPPESKILTNIIKNHPLRFSIAVTLPLADVMQDILQVLDYTCYGIGPTAIADNAQHLSQVPLRQSARLTPPVSVPTAEKNDEMILQDTIQVSLAEHKSREEQEARENVALVDEHLAAEEIEKLVENPENVDDSSPPRYDDTSIPGTRKSSLLLLSRYARVMIELFADMELKDNIVVAMPKITKEGHYTCNVHVEYEWKPPRFSSCKVFGHIHEECPKNTGVGEKKTVKKPSQTSRGVPVGLKIGKLRLLDNDGNPLVPTGIIESDSEVEVVFDETANLRISTSDKDGSDKGYGTNSLLEEWRDSYPDNDDYDPYDDDMYENHDLSEHLQSICDDLDITVRGRKKK
ncbi:hypothetical protein Tco_1049932, partial [Tanacetum coccineum]